MFEVQADAFGQWASTFLGYNLNSIMHSAIALRAILNPNIVLTKRTQISIQEKARNERRKKTQAVHIRCLLFLKNAIA